jgi:hypothetical protein
MLALGRKGLGEASLGLRLACDLRNAGDRVFFLGHESNARLFEGFPHLTFGSHASPLMPLYIANCLSSFHASSIILADYFTTTIFFQAAGLNPDVLATFGVPVFGIDTWDSSKTPEKIDLFGSDCQDVALLPKVKSICPVPFLAPHTTSGCYVSLPEKVLMTKKTRRHLRHALALNDTVKAVLFCTAEWQHSYYDSEAGRRMASSLPMLIAEYLAEMGEDVHLVHLGPRCYDLKELMNGRYHWLPPLAPEQFGNLVASMDLLLTANISASTIAKAMVCEVPTIVLQNSIAAGCWEEAVAAMPSSPSPALAKWLKEATPVFPFALWPLGYHRFVAPLLRDNPYVDAVEVVEFLDEPGVKNALSSLLFNTAARQEQIHRQTRYLAEVRSLPTGAQIIHNYCN